MPKTTSQGKCQLCKQTVSKQAMTAHLNKCMDEYLAEGNQRIFHLRVEGRGMPEYWLHLAVPASAPLHRLDQFLRDIWLECCGHLSAFHIAGETYESAPEEDPWGGRAKGMSARLESVVTPGSKFTHEYDFGSTTELVLQVLGERQGKMSKIQLLARNDPPHIPCAECGKPATQVCSQCIYEGPEAWLCDEHAAEHECGEDYFLPVVNSPRVGVCGYTG
jgi:hypothetical protein